MPSDIATRDKDAINKTFSGLMKILYPTQEQTTSEIEEVLQFSIECRKRVKDQLMRIDSTFDKVDFFYTNSLGTKKSVQTLEEIEYPQYYYERKEFAEDEEEENNRFFQETKIKKLKRKLIASVKI